MRFQRLVGTAAVLLATLFCFVPVNWSAAAEEKKDAGTTPPGRPPAALALPANPRRTPVVDVVERVRAAVVNIHSERTVHGPAAEELFSHSPSLNRINGMGTGIIMDPRGYIITNQHVVEDVNIIHVRLSDGCTYDARVLQRDFECDLALLKIDASRPLPTMPLGTSSDLMVGETVIAIGNAYGYEHTVTVGVVSAIKRDVTLNKEVSYKSLIQTDASINPGNSGGPLLNINGELIGVNVAIRAGAQGIGFAIPVDSMIRVAADLMSVRRRNNLWHGIVGRDCVGDPNSQKGSGLDGQLTKSSGGTEFLLTPVQSTTPPSPAGTPLARWLVVERTEPDSPATRAQLQAGDVLLQVGGIPVGTSLDLERTLLDYAAGKPVPLLVRRNGSEQKVELVLQSADRSVPPSANLAWRKLGVRLGPVNPELITRNHRQLHGGLAVLDVNPEGAAGKAGIQRGDILVGLHQWETVTMENVTFVLTRTDLASFNPLRFFIIRAGQIHRGWLQQID
jgi:serine protease Do